MILWETISKFQLDWVCMSLIFIIVWRHMTFKLFTANEFAHEAVSYGAYFYNSRSLSSLAGSVEEPLPRKGCWHIWSWKASDHWWQGGAQVAYFWQGSFIGSLRSPSKSLNFGKKFQALESPWKVLEFECSICLNVWNFCILKFWRKHSCKIWHFTTAWFTTTVHLPT